jgi:hypothetical protein
MIETKILKFFLRSEIKTAFRRHLHGLVHGLLEHLDGLDFADFFERRNFDVLPQKLRFSVTRRSKLLSAENAYLPTYLWQFLKNSFYEKHFEFR